MEDLYNAGDPSSRLPAFSVMSITGHYNALGPTIQAAVHKLKETHSSAYRNVPVSLTSPCATCQSVFEVRRKDHRFCSAKCRLTWFHRKQARARDERDAKVRLLLKEALGMLAESNEVQYRGR